MLLSYMPLVGYEGLPRSGQQGRAGTRGTGHQKTRVLPTRQSYLLIASMIPSLGRQREPVGQRSPSGTTLLLHCSQQRWDRRWPEGPQSLLRASSLSFWINDLG